MLFSRDGVAVYIVFLFFALFDSKKLWRNCKGADSIAKREQRGNILWPASAGKNRNCVVRWLVALVVCLIGGAYSFFDSIGAVNFRG